MRSYNIIKSAAIGGILEKMALSKNPPRPAAAWNPEDKMENGKFTPSDEVIANARKPSPVYATRVATQAAKQQNSNPGSMAANPLGFETMRATGQLPSFTSNSGKGFSPQKIAPPQPSKAKPVNNDPLGFETMRRTTPVAPRTAPAAPGFSAPIITPPANIPTAQPSTTSAQPTPIPAASTAQVAPPQRTIANDGTVLASPDQDLSGQGYTLIGYNGGQRKWAPAAQVPVPAPVTQRAPQRQQIPFKTRYDINRGVVPEQGIPDADYNAYAAAQKRVYDETGTAEDHRIVSDYVGRDYLNRTPEQIMEQNMEEKAGLYQAGRYIGPPRYSREYYALINKSRYR